MSAVSRGRVCCVRSRVCHANARPEDAKSSQSGAFSPGPVAQWKSGGLIICWSQEELQDLVYARNREGDGPGDPVSHVESAGPYPELTSALDRYLAGLLS